MNPESYNKILSGFCCIKKMIKKYLPALLYLSYGSSKVFKSLAVQFHHGALSDEILKEFMRQYPNRYTI